MRWSLTQVTAMSISCAMFVFGKWYPLVLIRFIQPGFSAQPLEGSTSILSGVNTDTCKCSSNNASLGHTQGSSN